MSELYKQKVKKMLEVGYEREVASVREKTGTFLALMSLMKMASYSL
jgi:hypothetical protein